MLADDFEIVRNESVMGLSDGYNTFTIRISDRDKRSAIHRIRSAAGFKGTGEPAEDFLTVPSVRYTGPKRTQGYETEDAYIRESFEPNGEGVAPTFRRISIHKAEPEWTFEDIDP